MSTLAMEQSVADRPDEPVWNGSAERQLIEAARRDPEALAELYRLHYQAIARHVFQRVGRASVAEDLIADVFLAMVRYLPRYRIGATPFRSWLYRLATNRVNRWARWQRRRACQELQDMPSPPESDDLQHEAARVRLALLSLPAGLQSVLSLHYLEGMAVATIAQILVCAEGTVKSRLSRGRERLRTILTDRGGDS